MNENKTTTEDTIVRMEKVVESDTTAKIEKVIEKDTKCNIFEEWVGKCITTCAKKVSKCTTTCAKKVGKNFTICAKKISESRFIAIMNAKYSEVYGDVRKALMKIACRLARKNETKELKVVEQLKGLDTSVSTIKTKSITIEMINIIFVLIFKKTVAIIKCFVVVTLNVTTIIGILVARVIYYTTKEIIYASKEIVLAFKNDVITWHQSEL